MKKNRIFLSYRRDDSPGYVSRLEDELERVFGKGRVFRDATDIAGGAKWKNVIDENLHSSAVLLFIIGPRWEQIWLDRIDDDVNYVALELSRAKELDVPVIPVTLDGTELSKGLDLGSINFIYDSQFYDISDKQGRWARDVARLVSLLESVPGVGSASAAGVVARQSAQHSSRSGFKWLAVVAGLLTIAAVVFGIYSGGDEEAISPIPSRPGDQVTVVPDKVSAARAEAGTSVWKETAPAPINPEPDISGTWEFKDGTLYILQRHDNGTYSVESPGNGSGQARYKDKMPGKLEIEMFGIGRGEFAGFNTGRALGWFVFDGSSQQYFGALVRVE
ncbi:MAG: toll/interleukin-1 receptor domain-containing protein [Granulosicoccus sp.]